MARARWFENARRKSGRVGLAIALARGLVGCSPGAEATRWVPDSDAGPRDSGVELGNDSDPGVQTLGSGTSACADDDAVPLVTMPESFTVFQHSVSSCQPLGSGILLKNTSTDSLRIDGLHATVPEFGLVVEGSFPIEISPGGAVPLRVFYRGTGDGSTEARLTVATSRGCREFHLRGLRTADTLITRTNEAIDFGRVGIGGVSSSQRLAVLLENGATPAMATFSAFGVDPPVFEIVDATSPETAVLGCDTRSVTIRFRAPSTTGAVEGSLLWGVTATLQDGVAEGLMFVPLYATVTDASP